MHAHAYDSQVIHLRNGLAEREKATVIQSAEHGNVPVGTLGLCDCHGFRLALFFCVFAAVGYRVVRSYFDDFLGAVWFSLGDFLGAYLGALALYFDGLGLDADYFFDFDLGGRRVAAGAKGQGCQKGAAR